MADSLVDCGRILREIVRDESASPARRRAITISADRADYTVAFDVANTGPGISPDELPHIFDRFTKSTESRGSGLGLAIARSLAEAHSRPISVTSETTGSSIGFVLPTAAARGG